MREETILKLASRTLIPTTLPSVALVSENVLCLVYTLIELGKRSVFHMVRATLGTVFSTSLCVQVIGRPVVNLLIGPVKRVQGIISSPNKVTPRRRGRFTWCSRALLVDMRRAEASGKLQRA